MTLTEYSHLKRDVKFIVASNEKHSELLRSLKDLFCDVINSPRQFEQILTIGQLLDILETRDALSEDNVGPLKLIAQRLPNNAELLKKITSYEERRHKLETREKLNYYGEKYDKIPTKHMHMISNPYGANISKTKGKRIFRTITEEIGTFWRDLGRHLKIRERVIDDIDREETTTKAKAKRLMEHYRKEADPHKWFFVLCDALEKSRRKDLSTTIQNIMVMDI